MKRKPRKGKTRDEKIFDTLKNSQWFLSECKKVEREFKRNKNYSYLKKEVGRICLLLPSYWENSVTNYILKGGLKLPSLQQAHVEYRQHSQTGARELLIKVYKHTSQEDILAIWPTVEKFKRNLKEIWAPDLEDLGIFEEWKKIMSEKGKRGNVARRIAVKFNLDEADIRTRLSRMKKQLGITNKPAKTTA